MPYCICKKFVSKESILKQHHVNCEIYCKFQILKEENIKLKIELELVKSYIKDEININNILQNNLCNKNNH